jgi:hypothetical protein
VCVPVGTAGERCDEGHIGEPTKSNATRISGEARHLWSNMPVPFGISPRLTYDHTKDVWTAELPLYFLRLMEIVHARDNHGEFLVAVEAKADETFGETVADALAAALDRKMANPRSNGVARIEQLAATILAPKAKDTPRIGSVRYQLLTATAGALRAGEARRIRRVIVIVQEFLTRLTQDARHQANDRDLDRFVARVSSGLLKRVEPGVLYGPLGVPGASIHSSPAPPLLFIGKAICNLRESAKTSPR